MNRAKPASATERPSRAEVKAQPEAQSVAESLAESPSGPADNLDSTPVGEGLEIVVPATHSPGEEGAVSGPTGARIAANWIVGLSVAAIVASALQIASNQREYGFFLLSLTFTICFAATWSDVATRRIPNVLTYPAVLLGLALNAALPPILARMNASAAEIWLGSSGSLDSLKGFGLCALIGIVSFMARGLGGGDVKLLAAVGALIGFHMVVGVLFNTLAVAAILGLLNWTLRGQLMRRLQSFAGVIYASVVLRGNMKHVYGFKATEGPFALSLMIGLITAQFFSIHLALANFEW